MNAEKTNILIVDDSPEDVRFVLENLKGDDYALQVATSGEKALEMVANGNLPSVILMDVMMPGMDGYETCRQIKTKPALQNVDIIFVSAHDTTEEKLAGYDAGGSDYIIKPIQPVELQQKIKLAMNNQALHAAALADKDMAMQTAMTAMSTSGELGVVLEFLKQSFCAENVEQLAETMVEAVGNYSLECSVQLRSAQGLVNTGSTTPVPPLEQELMTRLIGAGRIMERGRRLILNFDNVTLLVKNLPDDTDKTGRLRDHLAIIMDGVVARLRALDAEYENKKRSQFLLQLVKNAKPILDGIAEEQKKYKEDNMQIMDDIVHDFEEVFYTLGLTEEQEANLLKIIESGVERSQASMDRGFKLDEELRGIINQLCGYVEQ